MKAAFALKSNLQMYIWAILIASGANVHVILSPTLIIIVLPLDSELLAAQSLRLCSIL